MTTTLGEVRRVLRARAVLALCGSLALVACSSGAPASPPRDEVVDQLGDRRIVAPRLLAAPGVEHHGTDDLPPVALVLVDGTRRIEPPLPSLTGRITADGAVWVTVEHELIDTRGRVLAHEVELDIDVDPSGAEIAFGARDEAGGFGVSVVGLEHGEPRRVSDALAYASTPFFVGDGRLVVAGGREGEVAGLWVLDPQGGDAPVQLTNHGLVIGEPLGPTFVPPPAHQSSMRMEGDVLVYDDGEAEQRITIPREECSHAERLDGSALGARTEGRGAGEPITIPREECSHAERLDGSALGARTEGRGAGEPITIPARGQR